jgi:hypothetical protein
MVITSSYLWMESHQDAPPGRRIDPPSPKNGEEVVPKSDTDPGGASENQAEDSKGASRRGRPGTEAAPSGEDGNRYGNPRAERRTYLQLPQQVPSEPILPIARPSRARSVRSVDGKFTKQVKNPGLPLALLKKSLEESHALSRRSARFQGEFRKTASQ